MDNGRRTPSDASSRQGTSVTSEVAFRSIRLQRCVPIELHQSFTFMQRSSSTLLRSHQTPIERTAADAGTLSFFRLEISPAFVVKVLLGALEEIAPNWVLHRRQYALEDLAKTVASLSACRVSQ